MIMKIICFDLDGTLVTDSGFVHPADYTLLKSNLEDVLFIPASGRSLGSVKRLFARNGLFLNSPIPYPMVLQNGSILYGPYEKLVQFVPFSNGLQNTLIELVQQIGGVTYLFMSLSSIDRMGRFPFGLSEIEKYDFTVKPFHSRGESSYSKIMCISENYAALRSIEEGCKDLPVDGAFSMPTIFEITSAGINKGTGLRRLLDCMGVTKSQIVAAGNDQNDAELLNIADERFIPIGSSIKMMEGSASEVAPDENGWLLPMLHYPETTN